MPRSRIAAKESNPDNVETQVTLEAGVSPEPELPSASALRSASSEEVLETPPPRNLLAELDAKATPEKTCCPEARPVAIDESEKNTAAPDEAVRPEAEPAAIDESEQNTAAPDEAVRPEAEPAAIAESEKNTAAPDEAVLDVASFEERIYTRYIQIKIRSLIR